MRALILLAHAGEQEQSWRSLLGTWTGDPLVIALLALSVLAYAAGVLRLWHGTQAVGIRPWEVALFSAGIVSVVVALLSPLDALSDVLFAAHMSQHELLMLVSAPLLVMGRPLIALLWALPPRARLRAGGWTRSPRFKRVWHAVSHPFVVLVAHGLIVWVWHLPVLFEAALASEWVHALQHATFFLSAALFWWALVHGRYGRMGYGVSVGYVFATATHTGLLGALVTFARSAWYPTYVERAAAAGVNALEDQQLAGLIMWVPAGLLLLVLGLALFAAWMAESERRVRLGRTDALTSGAREAKR